MFSKSTDDRLATLFKKYLFHIFSFTFPVNIFRPFFPSMNCWVKMGSAFIKSNCDKSQKITVVTSKNSLKNSLQENLMESQVKTTKNKINILTGNQLPLKKATKSQKNFKN